jgi:hypothetical protein
LRLEISFEISAKDVHDDGSFLLEFCQFEIAPSGICSLANYLGEGRAVRDVTPCCKKFQTYLLSEAKQQQVLYETTSHMHHH